MKVLSFACVGLGLSQIASGQSWDQCNSEESCGDGTYDKPLKVWGYRGAADATIESSYTGGLYNYLTGAYACAESQVSNYESYVAYGANAALEATIDGAEDFYVHGSNAASEADITMSTDSNGYVECYGDRSCYKATINNAYDISARASYSLSEATINSNGVDVDIELRGYNAGYGATVNCNSGDTCTIDCYGNGCFGLILNCDGTCDVDCDNADCPVYDSDDVEDVDKDEDDWNYNTPDMFEDLLDECQDNKALFYSDYDNYAERDSDVENDEGYVCCSSDYGCGATNSISTTDKGEDIVCDGEYSCYGRVDTISTEDSDKDGNIWCSASSACCDTSMIGNGDGVAYCGGTWACLWNDISYFDSLYCTSSGSTSNSNREAACYYTEVTNVGNVYVTAPYGIGGSYLYTNGDDMNVVFASYYSGYDVTIWANVDGDKLEVTCATQNSCIDVTVYVCSKADYSVTCDDDTYCPTEIDSGDCGDPVSTAKESSSSSTSESSESETSSVEWYVILLIVVVVLLIIALISTIVYFKRQLANKSTPLSGTDGQQYNLMST